MNERLILSRQELLEEIKMRINSYRSIAYAIENGQTGVINLFDIVSFLDHPVELKHLIKGKTRVELISLAKKLKIQNYGRKNVTQLNQEVKEHEDKD